MHKKLRTTLEQSRLGFGIRNAKFTFLNKILLFSSNSTVSSVEILQMLKSNEFPLLFIRREDHKLGIFGIFWELSLTVVVLMSTFKSKNSLRTIEDEIS